MNSQVIDRTRRPLPTTKQERSSLRDDIREYIQSFYSGTVEDIKGSKGTEEFKDYVQALSTLNIGLNDHKEAGWRESKHAAEVVSKAFFAPENYLSNERTKGYKHITESRKEISERRKGEWSLFRTGVLANFVNIKQQTVGVDVNYEAQMGRKHYNRASFEAVNAYDCKLYKRMAKNFGEVSHGLQVITDNFLFPKQKGQGSPGAMIACMDAYNQGEESALENLRTIFG